MDAGRMEQIKALYVYRSYVKDLMTIMGVATDDVEDLTGDVFLKAIEKIDTLHSAENGKNWIRAIANNRARMYFRERSRHRKICVMVRMEVGEEFDVFESIEDEEASVEKILQEAERRKLVDKLLSGLSDINRRILSLRIWENYKFAEIADVLNLKLSTVKSIYRRCLKELEKNCEELFRKEDRYD